ncbi:MAG: NADH-quinone oxidoreductase subunit L, partial [Candidatus Dadabacteria bacterium]|nr:NADH-quinone oxidoreductase subunit L [Candidatus Dadabacteria bacterium]
MLALIVLAPLAGAVFNGLFFATGLCDRILALSRRTSDRIVGTIACASVLISAVLSTRLFLDLLSQNPVGAEPITAELFTWMLSGNLNIGFEFLFDSLSAVMALVVTWVGFLIHVYSIGYMHHDRCYARYFTYLNIFVFFMLVLILGSNFPMMFIGWEGVGLASYLLIGFWYQDSFRVYAGRKAFVVNRIGDFGFILGIFLIFTVFGSLDYQDVFSRLSDASFVSGISPSLITAMALLLFVGAVGKSAQFPLHVWLPDAMAGPTAVSALIHAATMVTAGVYMLSRCSVLFDLTPVASNVVLIVAAFTAFFAATIAITQNDIKKVLAYSTVSQLGYMLMAAGAGAYVFSIFHLVTHAFFKALLFLGAGSVIHAMAGEQDIRKMGGLRGMIPVTALTFLVATLAISGFPLLSGFFSKDEILASLYDGGHTFFWAVGLFTAVLTAFYMTRLYVLTFEGEARMDYRTKRRVHESPAVMTAPLVVLAVLSVFGGLLCVPGFMGESVGFYYTDLLKKFLSSSVVVPHGAQYASSHYFGHWTLVGFSVLAAFAGIAGGILLYWRGKGESVAVGRAAGAFRSGSSNRWYVDEIYQAVFVSPFNYLSEMCSDFDRSV